MILVADNDALLKLNAYALWDDACAVLGVSAADVRTLVEAPYVLRRYRGQAKKQSQYGADGIDRALVAVERAAPVDLPEDLSERDALLDGARRLNPVKPPIDPGEALLFAAAASRAEFYLTTGDKRALLALHGLPEASPICEGLAGRVLCVEHILLKLVEARGLDHVRPLVRAVPACDAAIRMAFGSSVPASEGSVLEGLRSYVANLRQETGTLLVPA